MARRNPRDPFPKNPRRRTPKPNPRRGPRAPRPTGGPSAPRRGPQAPRRGGGGNPYPGKENPQLAGRRNRDTSPDAVRKRWGIALMIISLFIPLPFGTLFRVTGRIVQQARSIRTARQLQNVIQASAGTSRSTSISSTTSSQLFKELSKKGIIGARARAYSAPAHMTSKVATRRGSGYVQNQVARIEGEQASRALANRLSVKATKATTTRGRSASAPARTAPAGEYNIGRAVTVNAPQNTITNTNRYAHLARGVDKAGDRIATAADYVQTTAASHTFGTGLGLYTYKPFTMDNLTVGAPRRRGRRNKRTQYEEDYHVFK